MVVLLGKLIASFIVGAVMTVLVVAIVSGIMYLLSFGLHALGFVNLADKIKGKSVLYFGYLCSFFRRG